MSHRGTVPARPVTLAVPPPPQPQFPHWCSCCRARGENHPARPRGLCGPPAPAGSQSGAAVREVCPARAAAGDPRAGREARGRGFRVGHPRSPPALPGRAGAQGAARAAGARLARARGGGAGHGQGTRRPRGGGSGRRGRRRPLAPCPAPPPSARSPGGPAGGGPRPQVPRDGRAGGRAGVRGPGLRYPGTQGGGGRGRGRGQAAHARGSGLRRPPRTCVRDPRAQGANPCSASPRVPGACPEPRRPWLSAGLRCAAGEAGALRASGSLGCPLGGMAHRAGASGAPFPRRGRVWASPTGGTFPKTLGDPRG